MLAGRQVSQDGTSRDLGTEASGAGGVRRELIRRYAAVLNDDRTAAAAADDVRH
jgi:hypothetical protein